MWGLDEKMSFLLTSRATGSFYVVWSSSVIFFSKTLNFLFSRKLESEPLNVKFYNLDNPASESLWSLDWIAGLK
jgi:hypothetical protein